MFCAVAVKIRQKIKSCALIYFSTQYMKIILQKIKKNRLCFSSFIKNQGNKMYRKKSTILTNKHHLISPAVHF